MARMESHEAAALRRQHATEGSISPADQGLVLIELERLLQERSLIRYRLGEMARGPWADVRRVLGELGDVFGDGPG